ncbi:hypothetical protein EJ08DRAFT_679279 [Tothia fuscella]|uniref:Phosphatidylinositol 4-kinase n=1 Tax=Tothia fuscella TaxID=1048955 RepID=A0A9P4NRA2_9PEZI|nr:hypothetical protein EJ08DRAFT_679279 [Tothia fuscella]
MPKARSGYARLAQAEEEEDELLAASSDHEDVHTTISSTPNNTRYAPLQPSSRSERMQTTTNNGTTPPRRRSDTLTRRHRSNSGVEINLKALNARFEKWGDEIAAKFKIRRGRRVQDEEQPEIQHSVFQAPDWIRPATAETLAEQSNDSAPGDRVTKADFDGAVEAVRVAIELGTHPLLISQGSSGSYFARNSSGKILAVFKPKDEEPYASKNPKWTKWIHRNLFPFFFGRACLIPNLSYISEAAAYVLDQRLKTNIVPYTDIVSLSSKSFHYDFWDRRAYYRKKKPFPEKQGSFQMFLKGYKDATQFLKQHPWPDQHSSNIDAPRRRKRRRWTEDCRPSGPQDSDDEDEGSVEGSVNSAAETNRRRVFWTEKLQQSLREELEKLVILDYIMRNTDRGLDNWMIRIDTKTQKASIVAEPAKENKNDGSDGGSRHSSPNGMNGSAKDPYKRREETMAFSRTGTPMNSQEEEASVSLGAIDNSLSWPWKHPDAWRSYPFGWLFLPVSLIGQPFSQRTRTHFLPLLTSKAWWSETQSQLRACFTQDSDFQERMYAKQIAVMKGQAWNVVETLKTEGHGPLELTRRARVHVWDDLVEVPVVAMPMRNSGSVDMWRRVGRQNGNANGNGFDDMWRRVGRQNGNANGNGFDETEEMDISAARASALQPQHDLLGLPSPSPLLNGDEERGNPFNVSRQPSQTDVRESLDMASSPLVQSFSSPAKPSQKSPANPNHQPKRSGSSYFTTSNSNSQSRRPNHNSRMSYDEPRPTMRSGLSNGGHHHRRFSLGGRGGSGSGNLFGDEWGDEDGDLGFKANVDREGNRKRVIVERLETVKAGVPFFTWC